MGEERGRERGKAKRQETKKGEETGTRRGKSSIAEVEETVGKRTHQRMSAFSSGKFQWRCEGLGTALWCIEGRQSPLWCVCPGASKTAPRETLLSWAAELSACTWPPCSVPANVLNAPPHSVLQLLQQTRAAKLPCPQIPADNCYGDIITRGSARIPSQHPLTTHGNPSLPMRRPVRPKALNDCCVCACWKCNLSTPRSMPTLPTSRCRRHTRERVARTCRRGS